MEVVTLIVALPGWLIRLPMMLTGKSAPRNIPAYRSNIPWPWVAKTTI